MISQINIAGSVPFETSVATVPKPSAKQLEISALADLALKNRPVESEKIPAQRRTFIACIKRTCEAIKLFFAPRSLDTCKEAKAFVASNKLVLKSKNERAFKKALIAHFKSLSKVHKDQKNMIESYKYDALANRIKTMPSHKTFLTFVRLQKQLALFDDHNKLLDKIVQGLKAIDAPERQKLKEKLTDLHQLTNDLLVGYSQISNKVDDIFAINRGNFAEKYRLIDKLVSSSFAELPLSPEKVTAPVANKSSSNLQKKLEDAKQAGNDAQVKSLERSIKDKQAVEEMTAKSNLNKSVVILPCSYGTGHKVAAQALEQLIGKDAHVEIIDPTVEVFRELDLLHRVGKIFKKDICSVQFFNWILKKQHYWLVNLQNKTDKILYTLFKKRRAGVAAPNDTKANQLLRQRLLMEKPDLIATTYHMDLNRVSEVAKDMGIPLLHVPTDFDVKMEEVFLKKGPAYDHFKMLLPDNNAKTLETATSVHPSKLHTKDGEVAGVTLRPEFYIQRTPEECAEIRKERGIDPDAKIILVLSGGGGQELPYPEMLMNAPNDGQKYHMIVVAGSNIAVGDKLKNGLKGANPNVTVEVAVDPAMASEKTPYYIGASELSRLHAISDVAITKPGGLTMAELMHTGVPMIPDRRVTPMVWEDFNIDVVKEAHRGLPYTGKENFLSLINQVASLGKKPKANHPEWFPELVTEMIAKAEGDASLDQYRKYKGKV